MESFLSAFVNGAVACVPLAGVIWIPLRVSRRWLNAATRYTIWWIALALVMLAPCLYLPRPHAAASIITMANPQVFPAEAALTPTAGSAPRASVRHFAPTLKPMWAIYVWCSLSALLLARLLLSLVALHRRKLRAARPGEDLQSLMETCLARCNVTRRVDVCLVDDAMSPMVAGPFRPSVLIPAPLRTALTADEMELVCLHEAAHVARHDDAALLLQRVIQAALAWNPLVHWISRQIDREREVACDDFVISLTSQPRRYASCLTLVAEVAGGYRTSPMAAAATDGRSHLAARVELLLDKTRRAGRRLLAGRLATSALLMAALSFVCAKSPALFAFPQVQVESPAPVAPPPVPAIVHAERPTPVTPVFVNRISFTVTDPLHRFVTGLDRDTFHVLEGGIERRISHFEEGDKPAAIWILWDVREPVDSQRLSSLRVLRAGLLADYTPQHPKVRTVQAEIDSLEKAGQLDAEGPDIAAEMSARNPDDRFFLAPVEPDAMRVAANAIKSSTSPRKAIVVVLNRTSQSDLLLPGGDFANAVAKTHVPVFPIHVPETPVNRDELQLYLMKVAVELRNQYVLEYAGAPTTRNAVEIKIAQPAGLPPLSAHIAAVATSSTR